MVINSTEQNISSNFVHFFILMTNNFGLVSFPRFQISVQNLNFSLVKFEIPKIQYHENIAIMEKF